MASKTIGTYLYKIGWEISKAGIRLLKTEGDAAQKAVDKLGSAIDKGEKETKELTAAAEKAAPAVKKVGQESTETAKKIDESAQKVSSLETMVKKFVATVGTVATVKRVFGAIISASAQMDALAHSAEAVGATAAGMARLAYATDLAGVNAGEMDAALRAIRTSAAQAAAGLGIGAKIWSLIGIRTRDENGNLKDTTKLIDELGEKFSVMDEGRAQALGKLLRISPAVVTALRGGLRDASLEYDRFLGPLAKDFDELSKKAMGFTDARTRLSHTVTLMWRLIASRFFDPFAQNFDRIRRAIVENSAGIQIFVSTVLKPLSYGVSYLAAMCEAAGRSISLITEALDGLSMPAKVLLGFAAAYVIWLRKITMAQIMAAATNPFVLWAVAISALLLVLDDLYVAMKGGRSAINWKPLILFFRDIKERGKAIVDWFKNLPDRAKDGISNIAKKFKEMWNSVLEFFEEGWKKLIKKITDFIPEPLKKFFNIQPEATEQERDAKQLENQKEARRQELLSTVFAGDPAGYEKAAAQVEQEFAAKTSAAPVEKTQAATPAANQQSGDKPAATAEKPAAPIVFNPATPQAAPESERKAYAAAVPVAPSVQMVEKFAGAMIGRGAERVATFTNSMSKTALNTERVIEKTPALGAPVTNNIDRHKDVKVEMPVTNNTNVNVTVQGDAGDVAGAVSRAVDDGNATLIRNLQTPVAAITGDDSSNGAE